MKIQVYNTYQDVINDLTQIRDSNEFLYGRLIKERSRILEDYRESSGINARWREADRNAELPGLSVSEKIPQDIACQLLKDVGKGQTLTSFVSLSACEEDGKTTYDFGEGILTYGAEYQTVMFDESCDTIDELVEKIQARLAARDGEFFAAKIEPIIYTVAEVHVEDGSGYTSDDAEDMKEFIESVVEEDSSEGHDKLRDVMYKAFSMLDNDLKNMEYTLRGLTPEERAEFERLYS